MYIGDTNIQRYLQGQFCIGCGGYDANLKIGEKKKWKKRKKRKKSH